MITKTRRSRHSTFRNFCSRLGGRWCHACPTPLMMEFSSSSFSAGNTAIVRHAADSTLDRPFQRRGSHRERFCVADRSLPLSLTFSLSLSLFLLRCVTRKHERIQRRTKLACLTHAPLSLSLSLSLLYEQTIARQPARSWFPRSCRALRARDAYQP